MSRKVLVIYNPKAGRGQFLPALPEAIDRFTKAGYAVEAYPTQAAGDAVKRVADIDEEYDMIVPVGGDGTLDEVVTGLIRKGADIPLGYIPMGSTNDYAISLGLTGNVSTALTNILEGKPTPLDVGIFNKDHVFIYVAAFGAFTDVAYQTNQDMKRMFGHAAYVMEAVTRLADLKPYSIRVNAGSYQTEGEYIFGMVTNSISVGGMKGLTGTDIELDDGLFEVTLIRNPKNLLEMQEVLGCLMTQNRDTDLIDYFKTDHLEVLSEEMIPWTVDGEYGGSWKQMEIENRMKAVRIFLNKNK